MPMTNLPDRPLLSVESATTAAITAPTKPRPTTTTISRPSARWCFTSVCSRWNSAPYSSRAGRGKLSPAGLVETGVSLIVKRTRWIIPERAQASRLKHERPGRSVLCEKRANLKRLHRGWRVLADDSEATIERWVQRPLSPERHYSPTNLTLAYRILFPKPVAAPTISTRFDGGAPARRFAVMNSDIGLLSGIRTASLLVPSKRSSCARF